MKTNDFCRTCGCTRSEKESRTPPGITTTTTTALNNERCQLLRNWPSGERKKKEYKTKIKTTDKTDKKDMRCTVFSPAAFSSLWYIALCVLRQRRCLNTGTQKEGREESIATGKYIASRVRYSIYIYIYTQYIPTALSFFFFVSIFLFPFFPGALFIYFIFVRAKKQKILRRRQNAIDRAHIQVPLFGDFSLLFFFRRCFWGFLIKGRHAPYKFSKRRGQPKKEEIKISFRIRNPPRARYTI
jgi:hypothetical protein